MKIATIKLNLNENIEIDWFTELKTVLEAHDEITEATVISFEDE